MTNLPPIGLLPAAGFATRLGLTHGSKEVLSVADIHAEGQRFCPVSHYLLRHYAAAGIEHVKIVTRAEKSDIPATLGYRYGTHTQLDYLCVGPTPSAVHTIAAGCQATEIAPMALGFPDIIIQATDVYAQLSSQLQQGRHSVALGLFPTAKPEKFDMVITDANHQVTHIDIKKAHSTSQQTWVCAVWNSDFTRYLIDWVSKKPLAVESHMGDVLLGAIADGLTIGSVSFVKGRVLDVGTPEDLAIARDHRALEKFLQIHPAV
ncbi:MAG: hypothetical protein KTR35_11505 [Gammaproteobacteria bacterium]|nr:hypothetical protein [Gammaproteobacteria bacterium]